MKRILVSLAIASSFSFAAFALAAEAPAVGTVTATCKDGTPYSGATMKGACRGHGGVDKNASAASAASTAAPAAGPAAAKSAPPAQSAAGGGGGKVWVNASTKVYHCEGDRYYGKTKAGEYMTETDAKAKGYHASHGKACAK